MGPRQLERTGKAPGKRTKLALETFEFSFYDWPGNMQRSGRKKEKNKKIQSVLELFCINSVPSCQEAPNCDRSCFGINEIKEQYLIIINS